MSQNGFRSCPALVQDNSPYYRLSSDIVVRKSHVLNFKNDI